MTHITEHKRIHLIGIGGCSMSGLASILKNRGYYVQGSDRAESPFTERLKELGVPVFIGHDAKNIGDCDLIIFSAAIKPDNIERAEAKRRGIPELERSEALGQLTEGYESVVGIAGCHGKTTITSMLALICEQGGPDATVHIGGFVDFLNGGVRLGAHDMFITEACEYVESFLTLRPTIALINNIDNDHLDYYGDMEHIVAAFKKFAALLPENGLLIGNTDDFRVRALMAEHTGRKLSYGMKDADYTTANINYDDNGCPGFDIMFRGEKLMHIQLRIPGEHSVMNAIAAAAVAREIGADDKCIVSALNAFRNTRRRFEYYGERNGVKYYHDYGHHPSEIAATMKAASNVKHNKLFCVFQCNSYTRAKTLFLNDVTCFNLADETLVPDIYPGREKDDGSVRSEDLAAKIPGSIVVDGLESAAEWVKKNAHKGDLVVCMSCGDLYKAADMMVGK